MLRLGAVVAVGLMALPALGDPPPTEAPAKAAPTGDLATLQGNWKPLSIECAGQPQMTVEQLKQVTTVFDHAEYHLYFVDRGVTPPKVLKLAVANLALDASTTPKSITFEFSEGPFKGQKRHGIYEIAGNQLKMCYGPTDKPKPATFTAPANSGLFLEVWARQTK